MTILDEEAQFKDPSFAQSLCSVSMGWTVFHAFWCIRCRANGDEKTLTEEHSWLKKWKGVRKEKIVEIVGLANLLDLNMEQLTKLVGDEL